MLFSSSETDDILATLRIMRHQEDTSYQRGDYLSLHQSNPHSHSQGPLQPVDASCRFKMAEWCGQIVDYCGFNHETVEIAMSILDRYCMTTNGQRALGSRRDFQLASMTCLYTAVKVFEPEAMDPSLVAKLSRGTCTKDDIEATERDVLMSLNYRINCPTATAFASYFLALFPAETISAEDKETLMDAIKQQIQHAVTKYELVGVKSSTIALMAFSNALACRKPYSAYEHDFVRFIATLANISQNNGDENVQLELYSIVEPAAPFCADPVDLSRKSLKSPDGHGSPSASPRSVWSSSAMAV